MSGRLKQEPEALRFLRDALKFYDYVSKGQIELPYFPQTLIQNFKITEQSTDNLEFYDLDFIEAFQSIIFEALTLVGVKFTPDPQGGVIPNFELAKKLLTHLPQNPDPEVILLIYGERSIPFFRKVRCLQLMAFSQFRFRESIQSLLQRARQGSTEALLNLISLDRSFLYAGFAKEAIIKAEYAGDRQFFNLLKKSVCPPSSFWRLKGKRNYYAFFLLYNMLGYNLKSDAEWAIVLGSIGLKSFSDPENVGRYRRSFGLTAH